MKYLYLILLSLLTITTALVRAQTNVFPLTGSAGIGTTDPNTSSLLDMVSTSKGILVPRMTKVQRDAIVGPATGLLIYQTNANPGFFYFNGSQWSAISTQDANKDLSNLTAPTSVPVVIQPNGDNTIDLGSSAFSWKDLYVDGVGSLGAVKLGNFMGTPLAGMIRFNGLEFQGFDGTSWISLSGGVGAPGASLSLNNLTTTSINQHLLSNINGTKDIGSTSKKWRSVYVDSVYLLDEYNLARINSFGTSLSLGPSGPADISTGVSNITIGKDAGKNFSAAASDNTLIGNSAGLNITSGIENVMIGNAAGTSVTTGKNNLIIGKDAGDLVSTGKDNVLLGTDAGASVRGGNGNIALGIFTLYNDGGLGNDSMNVAIGNSAGMYNTGSSSVMIGNYAGYSNVNNNNVFVGSKSGQTAVGHSNTFLGSESGLLVTEGYSNTFLGNQAGSYGTGATSKYNVYVGDDAGLNTNGAYNTFIGAKCGDTNGGNDNCIFIGYGADATSGLIDNAIAIGQSITVSQSNTIRLGGTSITKLGIGKNASASNVLEFQVTTAKLTTGGVWTNASDERIKDQKQQLDKNEILDKINTLKVERWHYLADENNTTHIGPYAQQFYALFEVGDDTTISTIDPAGVALIGIQAISEKTSDQQTAIETLTEENALLNDRLQKMELLILQMQNTLATCCNTSSPSTTGNITLTVDENEYLGQNIPNPFINNTHIPFKLPENCTNAKIIVTEMETGKIIIEEEIDCTQQHADIKLSTLAAGAYTYSLIVDGKMIATKQMIRLK